MRVKAIDAVAVVAAIASAALTLSPWVDTSKLGLPIRWNGLGIYIGEYGQHYGGLFAGLVSGVPGWVVVIASIAAAGALLGASRVRLLGLVACGSAVVAFVSAVLCLAYPAMLAGDAKRELGIALIPDREVLNSRALIAEAAATGVLVVCAVLSVVKTRNAFSKPDQLERSTACPPLRALNGTARRLSYPAFGGELESQPKRSSYPATRGRIRAGWMGRLVGRLS
ncbi:hypothetical protein [Mycobacterium paraffinicum]|uniref:hypothetical protein n=1 Tax=Mycobacterium paraffinicum TaxID=53378 RepID=UPI001FCA0B81|nr:hypothetical protein [Mycobacterium paraffinicum]